MTTSASSATRASLSPTISPRALGEREHRVVVAGVHVRGRGDEQRLGGARRVDLLEPRGLLLEDPHAGRRGRRCRSVSRPRRRRASFRRDDDSAAASAASSSVSARGRRCRPGGRTRRRRAAARRRWRGRGQLGGAGVGDRGLGQAAAAAARRRRRRRAPRRPAWSWPGGRLRAVPGRAARTSVGDVGQRGVRRAALGERLRRGRRPSG